MASIIPVGIYRVNVVVLVELIEHLFHILYVLGIFKSDVGSGNLCKVGGIDLVAESKNCITNCVEVSGIGVDGVLALITLDILCTALDRKSVV